MTSGSSKREFRRSDHSYPKKTLSEGGRSSLPQSPSYTKTTSSNRVDTRPPNELSPNEAMVKLKAHRRSKGLCFKCGEKWNPGHRCPKNVSLNAVKEIWKLLEDQHEASEDCPAGDTDSGDDLMHISVQAIKGTESAKTIRLQGHIAAQQVYMLIDSGSTNTFISEQLAASMPGWTPLHHPIQVRVANGSLIPCNHQLKDQVWAVGGHTFTTTFKIIPLSSYDIILGMDWLQQNSPMQIHWQEKWLKFSKNETVVTLKGMGQSVSVGSPISAKQLTALLREDSILYQILLHPVPEAPPDQPTIPAPISDIISTYADLFQPVAGLPPSRPGDHTIPLLPGAQPSPENRDRKTDQRTIAKRPYPIQH